MTSQPLKERIDSVFASGRFHLPVEPAVAGQAGIACQPWRSAEADLADLIGCDPVLACNLFRAANSAFYQGLPKVRTLNEAMSRIGADRTLEVIGCACRDGAPSRQARLIPRYLHPLWQHSLGCALGARWLAERCGYQRQADQAHLAGLLHDVGKWLLLAILEQIAGDGEDGLRLGDQLVEEVLESLHVGLGLRLLSAWNLPDEFAGAVGRHHQPHLDGEEPLVALVRLANQGCRKVGLGWAHEPELILPTTSEAQLLGIDELALAEFEIMLEDRFGI